MRYAIIDVETTGGNHRNEKITDVAIYIHDGKKVVDEFTSLINPEKHIPEFIIGLTGITNEMVKSAPRFFEVAKEIILKTQDAIFVAHNVNFDYNFFKSEFKQLGYDYNRRTLDTVKLSRKLLPGHASYSLGKLCDDLNIEIRGRHRAAGDALATVKLFEMLLKQNGNFDELAFPEKYKWLKGINQQEHREIILKLPETMGVYYLYNHSKQLIYIGKSKNIRQRIAQHLSNNKGAKAIEFKQQIAEVKYELTGSELIAFLLESDAIKKHQPIYNRKQRNILFNFGLFTRYNFQGYIEFYTQRISKKSGAPIAQFLNTVEAQNFLVGNIEKYQLCLKLCDLHQTDSACFNYGIKKCKGACLGEEPKNTYNTRAEEFIKSLHFFANNFYIINEGRDTSEKGVVQILHGKYNGFGFLKNESLNNDQSLASCITKYSNNADIQNILKNALRNNLYLNLIIES